MKKVLLLITAMIFTSLVANAQTAFPTPYACDFESSTTTPSSTPYSTLTSTFLIDGVGWMGVNFGIEAHNPAFVVTPSFGTQSLLMQSVTTSFAFIETTEPHTFDIGYIEFYAATDVATFGVDSIFVFYDDGMSGGWELADMVAVTSDTPELIHVDIPGSGNYNIKIQASSFGQKTMIDNMSVVAMSAPTGINDLNNTIASFNTYGTATSNLVKINANSSISQDVTILIYTIDGRKVFENEYTLQSGENNIAITEIDLSSGNYVAMMTGNGLKASSKFVIK